MRNKIKIFVPVILSALLILNMILFTACKPKSSDEFDTHLKNWKNSSIEKKANDEYIVSVNGKLGSNDSFELKVKVEIERIYPVDDDFMKINLKAQINGINLKGIFASSSYLSQLSGRQELLKPDQSGEDHSYKDGLSLDFGNGVSLTDLNGLGLSASLNLKKTINDNDETALIVKDIKYSSVNGWQKLNKITVIDNVNDLNLENFVEDIIQNNKTKEYTGKSVKKQLRKLKGSNADSIITDSNLMNGYDFTQLKDDKSKESRNDNNVRKIKIKNSKLYMNNIFEIIKVAAKSELGLITKGFTGKLVKDLGYTTTDDMLDKVFTKIKWNTLSVDMTKKDSKITKIATQQIGSNLQIPQDKLLSMAEKGIREQAKKSPDGKIFGKTVDEVLTELKASFNNNLTISFDINSESSYVY